MEELIKQVSKKAGISESQARKAIESIVDFLDDKLPAPLAKQISGIIKGEQSPDTLADLTKGLGGLFGDK